MKNKILCILLAVCTSIFFSCEQTDQPTKEVKWTMKTSNLTNMPIRIVFKQNVQKPANVEFSILAQQTVSLFFGSSGLLADPITKQMYDSAFIYFGTEYLLTFHKNDTNNNILNKSSYKEVGKEGDHTIFVHYITITDLERADSIK